MPQLKVARFFLGCNTPQGFFSLFSQFTQPARGYRCLLLKGGPGTGKSTLLRRLQQQCVLRGCPVEEIRCSSDADSLDGLILPENRHAILDATPPHTLEPCYPGAVEQTLSLGDCWQEDLLYEKRAEIVSLTDEISALHRQAVCCLGGAEGILREIRLLAEPHTDLAKIDRCARSLAERELPDLKRPGCEERRLLSAVTDQGQLLFSHTLELLAPRLVCIEDPYGAAAPRLIAALRQQALARGYHVITCPCGLTPQSKLDHLLIPSLGLGFVTSNRLHPVTAPGRAIHTSRFTDREAMKACRLRIRFLQKGADLLLGQAALSMADAKAKHDELEAIYRAAMDFSAVDARCAAASARLRRLLQ